MKACEVCGVTKGKIYGKGAWYAMDLCSKHRWHISKYGKIMERTKYDPNEFIVNGDITEIVTYNTDYTESGRTMVDTKCHGLVSGFKWTLDARGYTTSRDLDGNILYLHRLITNCPEGSVVDHISLNKSDNRLSNLRICTQSENSCNQAMRLCNTSGHKGVTWSKAANKWQAQIGIKNVNIYLGAYVDINNAIEARKAAEIKYFGEYRYKEIS